MLKITVQLSARSRLNPMNPPNTKRIATSGIMELKPSILPRSPSSPLSVSHALYAASFADEPKNVMTQSRTITNVTPREAAAAALPAIRVSISTLISPNPKIEIPHTIYPRQISSFRFPTLSENAPTRTVVSVAATELAPTIREMSDAEALNILYKNTFRYIFSTTHAICPMSPKISIAAQNFLPSFFFICIP